MEEPYKRAVGICKKKLQNVAICKGPGGALNPRPHYKACVWTIWQGDQGALSIFEFCEMTVKYNQTSALA